MVDNLDEALAHGDVIVVGNRAAEFSDLPSRLAGHQLLVDLAHVGGAEELGNRYDGINW